MIPLFPKEGLGVILYLLSFSRTDCVVMSESIIKIVIPAQAGIQNLLITLDSVSRFACGYSGEIGHVFRMKSAIDSGGNKAG